MPSAPFILVLHEPASGSQAIRRALADAGGVRLQSVTRLSSALARIAGGGVDGVVLDLTSPAREESEKLADFLKIRNEAPGLPIVAVCDSEQDALMRLTKQVGASASLPAAQCQAGLAVLLRGLMESRGAEVSRAAASERGRRGSVISLLGSKGGAGATTVALNTACALAQDRQVILAELRPTLGALTAYFKVRERVRDLTSLMQQPAPFRPWDAQVEALLWRHQRIPGLRVLFGPQTPYPELPIDADHAKTVLKTLESLAAFIIADLAPGLSDANRVFIEASSCLAIVIERDLVSLEAARKMLRAISSWEAQPQSIGAIVVSRAALADPVPIAEFESRLEIPLFAVIPPAADDCLAAQRAGQPLAVFDAESLAAQSLISLSQVLQRLAGPVQLGRKLVTT